MSSNHLVFNGLNAEDGSYLVPPITINDLSQVMQGRQLPLERRKELMFWHQYISQIRLGPKASVNPMDLAQTGWGVIFAQDSTSAIKDALQVLLDHRREQAGNYYKEYVGRDGYRLGENKTGWLTRHDVSFGPANPSKVPYYLLLVGSPQSIPYDFQFDLDVIYAVGRIHFDTLEEYAQYAESVVQVETRRASRPRTARFFAPTNQHDLATTMSTYDLVIPLARSLEQKFDTWDVQTILKNDAQKQRLTSLLGGVETPDLLFMASHGLGFQSGHRYQLQRQGAIVCQEWPGPNSWAGPLREEFFFCADDVRDDAQIHGLIVFLFACFGAGTSRTDDFSYTMSDNTQIPSIAPYDFSARLPQRLLAHPRGGALAVVGHVGKATAYSFNWPTTSRQTEVFVSTLTHLLEGYPVGFAMEFFNQCYAELATALSSEQIAIRRGKVPNDIDLVSFWTAMNDARNYVVIGDPAVRLETTPIMLQ